LNANESRESVGSATARSAHRKRRTISVVKRRHGIDRCRYEGYVGMNCWVGLGVIADNVVNIGRAMDKLAAP